MSHAATTWAFAQKIESSTKFVLVALADYAKKGERRVYPSSEALQTKTCLDRKTILAALKRLRDLSLIEDTGNRIGKTRSIPVYELHLEAVPKTELLQKRSCSENGTTSSPENGTTSPPHVIYSEPEKEPEVLITARKARCSHPGFEQFYERYPRKKAPEKARQAWDKNKPPLQACLAALEWQSKEWEDVKFIPYPASWLNAHSWEDVGGNGGHEPQVKLPWEDSL